MLTTDLGRRIKSVAHLFCRLWCCRQFKQTFAAQTVGVCAFQLFALFGRETYAGTLAVYDVVVAALESCTAARAVFGHRANFFAVGAICRTIGR